MSLWTLLTIVAGACAFGAALGAALVSGGGPRSLVIGLVAAVALAVAATMAAEKGGRALMAPAGPSEPSERRLRAVYIGAALWIFLAGYLANRVVSFLVAVI